MARRP